MRHMLLVGMVAGLLLAAPASAGAAKRFSGCVAESVGCTHQFSSGSRPAVQFLDRRHAHTHYGFCVRDSQGRRCWNRHTGQAGHWHTGLSYYKARVLGKHVVRFYVNGKQVARWKFRLVSEGD